MSGTEDSGNALTAVGFPAVSYTHLRYDDYAEWDISDVKESVGIDTAGSVQKEYEKRCV